MLLSSLSILVGAVLVPSDYLWLYSTHIILVCLYLITSKRLIVLVLTLLSLISVFFNEFSQNEWPLPFSVGQTVFFDSAANELILDSSSLANDLTCHNQKLRISVRLNAMAGDGKIIRDVNIRCLRQQPVNGVAVEIKKIALADKNGPWWLRQLYIDRQAAQLELVFLNAGVSESLSPIQQSKREVLLSTLDESFQPYSSWRFSRALLLGDDKLWSERDVWIIRTLGLAHLFVVSGLHTGFVFALGCLLSRFIWQILPPRFFLSGLSRWHLDVVIVIPTLVIYAYITGWGEPVIRASIMLSIYLLARVLAIKVSGYGVITLALWLVLLFDPRAILQPGLWLSFSMVYLLIGFCQTSIHWTRLFIVQLMLSTASMVLVLGWQEAISSMAILINLLLIPIAAFIWFPWGVLACTEAVIIGTSYSYALLDALLYYLILLIEHLAFVAPLFFFEQFNSFVPKLVMLLLLVYWVFQTPLKRGVFAMLGIWLVMFSTTFFNFFTADMMLKNQQGELVLKNEQGVLLSAKWGKGELDNLKIDAYIKSGYGESLALSADKGRDWSPRDLLHNHVGWLFLQDNVAHKALTYLDALQVNWLIVLPNESLGFYFSDGRILLRHSACIFSFFLFKSDTCKRVEKLESMLN